MRVWYYLPIWSSNSRTNIVQYYKRHSRIEPCFHIFLSLIELISNDIIRFISKRATESSCIQNRLSRSYCRSKREGHNLNSGRKREKGNETDKELAHFQIMRYWNLVDNIGMLNHCTLRNDCNNRYHNGDELQIHHLL